jgi:hypothetical protein
MPSKHPKVFISYAREDVGPARRLFNSLTEAGAEPWLDVENLLPGQHWELEIEKAISSFSWPKVGPQTQAFESAIHTILNGQPVAAALRYFSSKYVELAAQYLQRSTTPGDRADRHLWTAMIDARNQVLLGDPAARLKKL